MCACVHICARVNLATLATELNILYNVLIYKDDLVAKNVAKILKVATLATNREYA